MDAWSALTEIAKMLDHSATVTRPRGRLDVLRSLATGSYLVTSNRVNVAILPSKVSLQGPIIFKEEPSLFDVLLQPLIRQRAAFVVRGSIAPLCELLGLDESPVLSLSINSRGIIICCGRRAGTEVVVHAATGQCGCASISQRRAGAEIGTIEASSLAPELLLADECRLVAKKLSGSSIDLPPLSERELQETILAAIMPLKQFYERGIDGGNPDTKLIADIALYVESHPRAEELRPALDLITQWDRSHLKGVTVHGDYWLGNVLLQDGRVSGIVDWELARVGGCPGIDALQLGFMSYAMWANLYVSELLADLWTQEWRFPWLGVYCDQVGKMFSLSPDDLKNAAALLWLNYFRSRNSNSTQWEDQMMAPMRKAITQGTLSRDKWQ